MQRKGLVWSRQPHQKKFPMNFCSLQKEVATKSHLSVSLLGRKKKTWKCFLWSSFPMCSETKRSCWDFHLSHTDQGSTLLGEPWQGQNQHFPWSVPGPPRASGLQAHGPRLTRLIRIFFCSTDQLVALVTIRACVSLCIPESKND